MSSRHKRQLSTSSSGSVKGASSGVASTSRPKFTRDTSTLTKTNLNPVLRITKRAPSTTATSVESSTSLPASRSNEKAKAIGTSSSDSKKASKVSERSRKSSSESLRKHIERSTSPAPPAASTTSTNPKPAPMSFVRHAGSPPVSVPSSPSASISSSSIRDSGFFIRPASPAPAIASSVEFPSIPSPSHSTASSTLSPSQSFDTLKSALRDTLVNDARERRSSNGQADEPRMPSRTSRRSVSFMLDEEQSVAEAAKSSEPLSSFATLEPGIEADSASASPIMHANGVETSMTSSDVASSPTSVKRIVYPVKGWTPPTPPPEEDEAEGGPMLPLDLAKTVYDFMQQNRPAFLNGTSPGSSPSGDTSSDSFMKTYVQRVIDIAHPLQTPTNLQTESPVRTRLYQQRNLVVRSLETVAGLWLAIIWLAIDRILGNQ